MTRTEQDRPATLLVWREAAADLGDDLERRLYPVSGEAISDCKFCDIPLVFGSHDLSNGDLYWFKCPLCGWEATIASAYALGLSASRCRTVTATEFDINEPQVAMDELASHLKRRFSDVFALRWESFERLVEDVFRTHGYKVKRTKLSWDDGADLVLLSHSDDTVAAIVECKKYASNRSVGIGIVRGVIGAAVYWQTRRAVVVTTTRFTQGAHHAVDQYRSEGFTLDLVGASELFDLLSVYNHDLPPLQDFTQSAREELILTNRRLIREQGVNCLRAKW